MSRLPVIVGLGGINAAGRLSLHHAYRRMVIDALPGAVAASTYRSLAGLMNIHKNTDETATRDYINAHTLVRKIECFDTASIPWQRNVTLGADRTSRWRSRLQRRQLPDRVPADWQISARRRKGRHRHGTRQAARTDRRHAQLARDVGRPGADRLRPRQASISRAVIRAVSR